NTSFPITHILFRFLPALWQICFSEEERYGGEIFYQDAVCRLVGELFHTQNISGVDIELPAAISQAFNFTGECVFVRQRVAYLNWYRFIAITMNNKVAFF